MTPEQHAAKIRELEAPMAAAYLAEVRAVESEATVAEVERLLAAGDRPGLIQYLSLGSMPVFVELMRSAFVAGARNEAGVRWRFDSNTWSVINLLMQESQAVTLSADVELGKVIDTVMSNGGTYRSMATDLLGVRSGYTGRREGGLIGMTGQQAEWVYSAKAQVRSNQINELKQYLRRKERDVSNDGMVKRKVAEQEEAKKEGKNPPPGLNEKQADKVAKDYSKKLSVKNAERIAKQAAASAYNAGRNAAIQQLIDKGIISASDVSKRWRTMRDERVRHSHAPMNNQKRPLNEPFVSGLGGLLMYPSDRSMGASDADIYGCRCVAEYVIKKRF